VALADLEASAAEVALIVTVAGLGTLEGAVKRPVLLTVPHVEPLHPEPERLHVTVWSVELFTVAVNWAD
jgi:hypothetical protein